MYKKKYIKIYKIIFIISLASLTLIIAPQIFSGGLGIAILSQMGIAIVACLSYNLLLGQGGMLSFGHAVYTGMGAFFAIHALNKMGDGSLPIAVSLIPIIGGLAGMVLALILGYITTRKSGATFAMITMGIGELVSAFALMFPVFFGGEGGISGNRVIQPTVMGIDYAAPIQVYYLIVIYTLLSAIGLFALTKTPFGLMLNAVRDNADRVEFIGYNAHHIRYVALIVAGFFAGISGGLSAIHFEMVTIESLSTARSGAYLLFTFLGGTGFFFGPIIGAIGMVLALVVLSEFTALWAFYVGLLFIIMTIFSPQGIIKLFHRNP